MAKKKAGKKVTKKKATKKGKKQCDSLAKQLAYPARHEAMMASYVGMEGRAAVGKPSILFFLAPCRGTTEPYCAGSTIR